MTMCCTKTYWWRKEHKYNKPPPTYKTKQEGSIFYAMFNSATTILTISGIIVGEYSVFNGIVSLNYHSISTASTGVLWSKSEYGNWVILYLMCNKTIHKQIFHGFPQEQKHEELNSNMKVCDTGLVRSWTVIFYTMCVFIKINSVFESLKTLRLHII